MKESIIIASGGAIGAFLRYATNLGFEHVHLPYTWVTATAVENVAGSFIIGFIFMLLQSREGYNQQLNLFFITGVLGSYTSYSAFSAEAFFLLGTSVYSMIGYLVFQIGTGLLAVTLGYFLAKRCFAEKF
jgi:CrcB protein